MRAFAVFVASALALPSLGLKVISGSGSAGKPSGSIAAAAVNATDLGFADVDAAIEKDGKLTVNELATFCTSNGAPWSMCKALFEKADANKDHDVTAEEWKKLSQRDKSKLRASWATINLNSDQVVSKKEWDSYCKVWMTPRPTKAQCDKIFNSADKNGDFVLDKTEFSAGTTGVGGKKGDKGTAGGKDKTAKKASEAGMTKKDMRWACTWVTVLLLINCCCVTPAAPYVQTKSNVGGQVLGAVSSVIPWFALFYLWWSSILGTFWSDGWSAVGTTCAILCILATIACCCGIANLIFVCLMATGVASLAMLGGKPSGDGPPATPQRVKEVDQETPDRVRQYPPQPSAQASAARVDAGDASKSLVQPVKQVGKRQDAPFTSLRGVPSNAVPLGQPRAPVSRSAPSYPSAASGADEPHDVGMPVPTRPTLDGGAGAGDEPLNTRALLQQAGQQVPRQ